MNMKKENKLTEKTSSWNELTEEELTKIVGGGAGDGTDRIDGRRGSNPKPGGNDGIWNIIKILRNL